MSARNDPMENGTTYHRVRTLFNKDGQVEYTALEDDASVLDDHVRRPVLVRTADEEEEEEDEDNEEDAKAVMPFSWFEYTIFLILGIAMLWAWNMFLAAAPYFETRFADSPAILNSFQSAITSVGTLTNLASMLILGAMQSKASYPKRIISALILNILVFILLAISTSYLRGVSSAAYLAFTLTMVFITSNATGLCQNGAFAFAASFGRPEYIQAIMTGQALAGVLPSVAQIVAVLALPAPHRLATVAEVKEVEGKSNTTAACAYFLTATAVSTASLLALLTLIRRYNNIMRSTMSSSMRSLEEAEQAKRKVVGMGTLYKKLRWLAASVFMCFAVTMFFPVFTQKIVSVIPREDAPRLFQPAAFIPLGFLVWNLGDLCGRLLTLLPFTLHRHPTALFIVAIVRAGFIPLYLLCNIKNNGAIINSDAFYLFVVQLGFGITNGWVASTSMMAAGEYVDDGEREAAGSFMGFNLVAGLTVGSLLSFAAAGVQ